MDKCYTLLCVTVFLVSVIHGFSLGYRNGNRIATKLLDETNITKQVLAENATFDLLVLPATSAAMTTCTRALKASSQQVEAAAAEFQEFQVVDEFRAQMNAALRLFRACVEECFVEGHGVDEVQQAACASALRSHIRVWAGAEKLYSQYLDLEINRAQLTASSSWWSSSSNSSD